VDAAIYQGRTARGQRRRELVPVVDDSPARRRVNVGTRLVPTWSELLALFSAETIGQQEMITSRILHDAFRVDAIAVHTTAPEGNGLNWIVGFMQDQTSGILTSDRRLRGVYSLTGDVAAAAEISGVAMGTAIAVGTIVRNPPGRVFFNVLSGEASAKNTTAYVSITHLRPVCCSDGDPIET
jgi:hypothetical protein